MVTGLFNTRAEGDRSYQNRGVHAAKHNIRQLGVHGLETR